MFSGDKILSSFQLINSRHQTFMVFYLSVAFHSPRCLSELTSASFLSCQAFEISCSASVWWRTCVLQCQVSRDSQWLPIEVVSKRIIGRNHWSEYSSTYIIGSSSDGFEIGGNWTPHNISIYFLCLQLSQFSDSRTCKHGLQAKCIRITLGAREFYCWACNEFLPPPGVSIISKNWVFYKGLY